MVKSFQVFNGQDTNGGNFDLKTKSFHLLRFTGYEPVMNLPFPFFYYNILMEREFQILKINTDREGTNINQLLALQEIAMVFCANITDTTNYSVPFCSSPFVPCINIYNIT